MGARRDTFIYDLKNGNKIVYRGITTNPGRREQQHRQEGKDFRHMYLHPNKRTPDGARKRERQLLETYQQGHGGKNPKYNDTP